MKLFKRKSDTIVISELYDNYRLKKYRFREKSDTWSEDKKSFLIDSILKNYPMPTIYLRPYVIEDTGKVMYDVIDGNQRLETILDFINNKIPDEHTGLTTEEMKQFWSYSLNVEYWYEQDEELIASVLNRMLP